jgi:hypothetical protein
MLQVQRLSANVFLTVIVFVGAFALALFPPRILSQAQGYIGRSTPESDLAVALVPWDPNELASGNIVARTEPVDRVAALTLVRKAAANGFTHNPNMNPFDYKVTFTATGNLKYIGQGQITETWLSGQNWRVTESIGNYSLVRIGYANRIADQQSVSMIPMRAQMLRNEVMWAIGQINGRAPAGIRTATAQFNGQPVTCVLLSGVTGQMTQTQSRLWEETEYCVSNSTGLLLIHSVVPGTYTVFGYTKHLQFHGKAMPDHLTTYVAGARVIDADMTVADPSISSDQLTLTRATIANDRPAMTLSEGIQVPLELPGPASLRAIQIAMVHAEINAEGTVTDVELSAASDPDLALSALDAVKQMNFGRSGQSHAYIEVRFVPQSSRELKSQRQAVTF